MTLSGFHVAAERRPGGGFAEDRPGGLGVDDILSAAEDGLGFDVDGEGSLRLLEGLAQPDAVGEL